MEDLASFAKRPLAFSWRFVRRHRAAHAVILVAVALAVVCSIFTQYGVKLLVDTLSLPQRHPTAVWHAFALLVALIAADNLLWRLAAWVGNSAFASVTGDVRRDLFRHLTGHAPSYFATWQPGVLTSRISATSNAMFTVENLLVWNVLPPCMATFWAIALVGTVSLGMAASLIVVAALVVAAMFLWAAAGKPLHHEFACRAAAVDGELTDVVGNMAMVKAFGGTTREHNRFDLTVGQEIAARQRSLRYLERLRIVHAVVTVALTIGLLELTGRARAMQEFSFHVFEAFAAATVIYLLTNLVVVLFMRWVESRVRVPGLRAARNLVRVRIVPAVARERQHVGFVVALNDLFGRQAVDADLELRPAGQHRIHLRGRNDE